MAMTTSKRQTVGDRDGWQCHYCREHLTLETMTVDHVYPHRKGGSNANWNLVTSCQPCNGGFSDRVDKCDCAFCLNAYRRTMAPARPRRPQAGTLADVAGYQWTADGWKPYGVGESA